MRTLSLFLSSIFLSVLLFAQVPDAMQYQAVVRDNSGVLVTNQSVQFQFSVLAGSLTGPASYVETQIVTTNDFGQVSLEIGRGVPVSGTFAAIDWPNNSHFLKIELDITGGSNFVSMGTSELLSVPYAQHANTSIDAQSALLADSATFANESAVAIVADTARYFEEQQVLSINQDTIFISDGNYVILPPAITGSQGKTHIVFSGNITDAQAAQKFQAEFGPITQVIRIVNTTQLTTLDLSGLVELVELTIQGNNVLETVDLPDLQAVFGRVLVDRNDALTNLNVPKLATIADVLEITENAALVNQSFAGLLEAYDIVISQNELLRTLGFPVLEEALDIDISSPLLLNLSFDGLQKCRNIHIADCPVLSGLAFPLLEEVNDISINGNAGPQSITAPNLVFVNQSIDISNNLKLSQIDMSSLATVEGGITISSLNASLQVSFPVLSGRLPYLSIRDCNKLTDIALPSLDTIGFLLITNNPLLGTVNFNALTVSEGTITINGGNLSTLNLNSIQSSVGLIDFRGPSKINSLSMPVLHTAVDGLNINFHQNLTAIDLSLLATARSVYIDGNQLLPAINLPSLTTTDLPGGGVTIGGQSVTSVDISKLRQASVLRTSNMPLINSLDISSLEEADYVHIQFNTALASVILSSLAKVNIIFQVTSNANLSNLDLTSLTTCDEFSMQSQKIQSLDLSKLETAGHMFLNDNSSLMDIDLSGLKSFTNLELGRCMLPSAEVNSILADLVSINPTLTNTDILLFNQTPPAPPTGQGITDKNTLISNGNNVQTD